MCDCLIWVSIGTILLGAVILYVGGRKARKLDADVLDAAWEEAEN